MPTVDDDDEPDAIVIALDDFVDAPLAEIARTPQQLATGSSVLDLDELEQRLVQEPAPTKNTRLVIRTDDRKGLRRE